MNRSATLIGSIRLVPQVDSIGVPVFGAVRGNMTFVPEMDGDFRIVEFNEFYNEHGYTIDYNLPPEFQSKRYSLGSTTPIPFWIDNFCFIIPGDADKDEPQKLFGSSALSNPVLADIARLLDDARSGRIADRMKEWTSNNIASSFADVFYETPVRSRYWVTRYRIAVAKARKMAKPPHPIDNLLRQVAGDWLVRFGSKTDLSKLGGLLGSTKNAIFTKRQITDILFAFLVSKLAQNEMSEVEMYVQEPSLHDAFPRGLYQYYIDHGWPRVPFHYHQVDDFGARMMECLSLCHEKDDYRAATKLALILYGRGRVPEQVDGLTRTYLNYVKQEFDRMRYEARSVFNDCKLSYTWKSYADALLEYYDRLMDLDGIIAGAERAKRVPYNNRFGVTGEFLKDLKKIQAKHW